jgi:hypothetical protein
MLLFYLVLYVPVYTYVHWNHQQAAPNLVRLYFFEDVLLEENKIHTLL